LLKGFLWVLPVRLPKFSEYLGDKINRIIATSHNSNSIQDKTAMS